MHRMFAAHAPATRTVLLWVPLVFLASPAVLLAALLCAVTAFTLFASFVWVFRFRHRRLLYSQG
jgi:hypothetical protein